MAVCIPEAVLKRDRWMVSAGLGCVIAIAWAYLFHMAWGMGEMTVEMGREMAAPHLHPWGISDFLMVFLMWTVMQVAMMTPSAAPMVLVFSKISRQRHEEKTVPLRIWGFFLGYLLVWTGFSLVATAAQWGLHSAALLSPMMVNTSPVLGGALLIFAGIFQFTPLKQACLNHCRSPLGFFLTEWREGTKGALIMGLRHGGYCVLCCWLLMAILFVAGVMNLLWIAAIAAYVLLEKISPAGQWASRVSGLLICGWGLWMAGSALI